MRVTLAQPRRALCVTGPEPPGRPLMKVDVAAIFPSPQEVSPTQTQNQIHKKIMRKPANNEQTNLMFVFCLSRLNRESVERRSDCSPSKTATTLLSDFTS